MNGNNATMQVSAVNGGGPSTNSPVSMNITLTGYADDADTSDITAADNLLTALAKVQARLAALEGA
jgi:hypothetical protein